MSTHLLAELAGTIGLIISNKDLQSILADFSGLMAVSSQMFIMFKRL